MVGARHGGTARGVRAVRDAVVMRLLAVVATLAAVIAAVVALWLARALQAWRRSRRARVRAARASAGEDLAGELLVRAGFRIVARQVRITWAPLVDGEPHQTELRADYLVALGDEQLVAEVKTGAEAPSLATAATRRQLLEYHVAFAVDGVLLVCPERDEIHRVEFPLPAHARRSTQKLAPTMRAPAG
jgi:hypothetical protein